MQHGFLPSDRSDASGFGTCSTLTCTGNRNTAPETPAGVETAATPNAINAPARQSGTL
jgi:hypothetical protein